MGIYHKLTTHTGGTADIALETVTRAQAKTSQSCRATTALQRTGRVIIGLAFGLSLSFPAAGKAEATTFSFTKIVDTNTPIPGCTGIQRNFGLPSLDKGIVAFSCGAFEPGFFRRNEGIYKVNKDGSLKVVANQNTPVPDGTGNFQSFDNDISLDKGVVAFVGASALGLQSFTQGLYTAKQDDSLQVVANQNTLIPGGTGNFGNFAAVSLDKQTVAFIGAPNGGVYTNVGGSLQVVADQNTPIPGSTGNFTNFRMPSLDKGNVVFVGDGAAGFGGAAPQQGIYTNVGGSLKVVADQNIPIPGGTGNFTNFANPLLDNGNVVFQGSDIFNRSLGVSQQGIYMTKVGGTLKVVADQNTAVPGGIGNFVTLGVPSFDKGNVAFFGGFDLVQIGPPGSFRATKSGIYANLGGSLMKIIDSNDSLDGKTIIYVDLGREALSGDQIVFRVGFTDGSQGIYVTRLGLTH